MPWIRFLLYFALSSLVPLLGSCSTPSPPTGGPLAEYEMLKELRDTRLPPGITRGSDAHLLRQQERLRTLHDLGLAYMARYPQHALRWDALLLLRVSRDLEIQVQADGSKLLIANEKSRREWEARYATLLEQLLASKDARKEARREALRQLIDLHVFGIVRSEIAPAPATIAKVVSWMNDCHRADPRSEGLAPWYRRVASMLNVIDPPQARKFIADRRALHRSDQAPDPRVRQGLDAMSRLMDAQEKSAGLSPRKNGPGV